MTCCRSGLAIKWLSSNTQRSLAQRTPPERPKLRAGWHPRETVHGTLPSLKWSFADSHNRLQPGGWARQTTLRELPIATQLARVNMRLEAGAVRELHWHKEGEWSYMLKGRARVTSVDQELRTYQDDVREGEGWFFPAGIPHSIQRLEGDCCEFLLVFDDGNFNEDETFLFTSACFPGSEP
jgi:oxalate decarboxylase